MKPIFRWCIGILVFSIFSCTAPGNHEANSKEGNIHENTKMLSLEELIKNGKEHYYKNDFQKANKYFSMAARKYDSSATSHAWYALNLGRLAGTFEGNKGAKYGAKSYSEMNIAIEIDSKNATARMARGQNCLYAPPPFHNYAMAIKDFLYVLENNPENAEAIYLLSLAYKKNGEEAHARNAFNKLKEKYPDNNLTKELEEQF